MTAILTDILAEVKSDIEGLSLTGINSGCVVITKTQPQQKADIPGLPGVAIWSAGIPTISPTGGTNERDDVVYPIGIAFVQPSNQDQDTHRDRMLTWLETTRKHFIRQPLTVTTVYDCLVDPRDSFHPGAFAANYDVGGMILRFVSREARG